MVRALVERELTLNLEATGCNKALIRAFLCSWKAGKKQEPSVVLKAGRAFGPDPSEGKTDPLSGLSGLPD